MNVLRALGLSLLTLSIAGCGGGDDASTDDRAATASFGNVAFTTYEYAAKRNRLVFTSDTKVKKTWANMSGPAVSGTYTKNGNEIEVQWDPEAEHNGSLSEKYRQMGPCSMARYERVDKEGVLHDDSPRVFEQTEPKCDTLRVTN